VGWREEYGSRVDGDRSVTFAEALDSQRTLETGSDRALAVWLQNVDPKTDGAARDWVAIYDECSRILYQEVRPAFVLVGCWMCGWAGVGCCRLSQLMRSGLVGYAPLPLAAVSTDALARRRRSDTLTQRAPNAAAPSRARSTTHWRGRTPTGSVRTSKTWIGSRCAQRGGRAPPLGLGFWGSGTESVSARASQSHSTPKQSTPTAKGTNLPNQTQPPNPNLQTPIKQVPKVYWQYSTQEVLVLEYCPGVKINDGEAIDKMGLDRQKLARLAVESYLQQILRHGFFHVGACACLGIGVGVGWGWVVGWLAGWGFGGGVGCRFGGQRAVKRWITAQAVAASLKRVCSSLPPPPNSRPP